MKLAVFVALATIATVASYNPTVHSLVFQPGEQYVYHYKGQILSGIPKSSKQFSGIVIDTLVLLQFQQDNRVVMKLENIKLFKVENLVSGQPDELLPESEMIRLTGEQEHIIVQKLVLPLKFSYDDGEIRQIQKESSDKYWSVNIKKGILSMLQVTLKEKHSISSDSSIYYDPTMSRIKSYGSRSYGSSTSFLNMSPKTNTAYKVKETDVTGNCETKYTIITDKSHLSQSSSLMYVTAVRNFEDCVTKPFNIEGLFQGVYSSPNEKELIQKTVHTDYVISGDRSHFLIREATRHSKFFVLVNGLEGGDVSSFIHQTLKLKQTTSISSPIHLSSPKLDTRGLQMIIPKASLLPERENYEKLGRHTSFIYKKTVDQEYKLGKTFDDDDDDDDDNEDVPLDNSGEIVQTVENKLQSLIECLYVNNVDQKCSVFLMDIAKLLKESGKQEIKTIYNRHVKQESWLSKNKESKKGEILLDILATIPNPEAAKVLVELIRERKISPLRGSLKINAMSVIVKPTPTLIKLLLELSKELRKETTATSLSGETMLRQSALLAVGTLTYRLKNIVKSRGKPVPELISFVDSISMELKRLLEETRSEAEMILITKTMGNMGGSENILTLKRIIEDRRLSPKVRVSAVFGLRRSAKELKKQVVPILMGVYMDVKEVREVRQAAFLVILKSNPAYPTLQMIAHRLRHEPSSQIRSLVYTNLINLAFYTSHQPEHKQLLKNARLVIKTIPPVHVSLYDSMTLFVNKFSEELDLGAGLEVTKIKSKLSGLPEALVANLQGTLFGKHRRIVEVGAEGKSLEVLLRKLLGPHGIIQKLIKGKINLEDIVKPLIRADLGETAHKIAEIMSKMRMELPVEGEPFSSVYLHLLGNELQYLVVNAENTKDLIYKVMNFIPELIMKLRSGTSIDVVKAASLHSALTVATPIGIPLSFNHTLAGLVKAEVSVKVDNMPTDIYSYLEPYKRFTLSQSWNELRLQPFNIPELKLDVTVKPVVDVTQFVSFGVDLRWMLAGVGVKGYLKVAKPFRASAELNKRDHSLSLKYYPTKQVITSLHAEVSPILYFAYVPVNHVGLPCSMQVKELKSEEIVKTKSFHWKTRSTMTGLEYEVAGVYSLCGPTWCPIMPMFGKQEVLVSTKSFSNVDFVEMKIKSIQSNFEFEGIPSHIPTEELFKDLEEEYNMEDSDSMNYRTASRHSIMPTSLFEPINVDEIFQEEVPIKRQLRIIVRPSNKESPALKSQLTWLMSRRYWLNQFNLQILRAASQNMPEWKVVVDNVVNPLAWYPEEIYRGHKGEYLVKSLLLVNMWGESKVFKLKVVPGSPFDFTEDLKKHTLWPANDLPQSRVQKFKYTLELDFPEIRNYHAMKLLTTVQDTIKYYLYNKLTSVIPHEPLSRKLIVSVQILPEWEKMNLIVKSPREDLYISNVPFYWNPFLPFNDKVKLHNTYSWDHYKPIFSEETEDLFESLPYHKTPLLPTGQCFYSVESGKLITFDNVHLPLHTLPLYSQKSCSFVLAQHCTRDGLFSVILKGDSVAPQLKFILPQLDLDMIILNSKQVTVLVNGQPKTVIGSQAIYIKDQDMESGSELYKIEKIGSTLYKVEAIQLGLQVILNSENKNIRIKLSPVSMLQGQICGACGNSDFDGRNDMYTSRDFHPDTRDYTEFIKSSLIPSESCSYESLRPKSEEHCKKTTQLIIRRYDNEMPMTCRSEREVIECAKGCRPAQTRSVKTCFRCQSESGQSLVRRTYYQPTSVLELEDNSTSCEDFSERIEVPITCIPAY